MFLGIDEEQRQTVSPWSPTAARSPSSLWLRLSVSPPAGVWRLLLRQCLSASGWASHLSIVWRMKETKFMAFCFWILGPMKCRLETASNLSPPGLVVQLVFQLPHFLLNDAHPLSVYEDCVLLENARNTFIRVLMYLFIAKLFCFSNYYPVQ